VNLSDVSLGEANGFMLLGNATVILPALIEAASIPSSTFFFSQGSVYFYLPSRPRLRQWHCL
jgi:hypothetical protein